MISRVRKTEVQSNGSKWAGEKANSLQQLLKALDEYALDRAFEAFGNFVEPLENGAISFFGNFQELSHVFHIVTTDEKLIARLTSAIRANQQRADYLSQEDYPTRKTREEAATLDLYRIRQEKALDASRRTLEIAEREMAAKCVSLPNGERQRSG
jgi:hypothetical protein